MFEAERVLMTDNVIIPIYSYVSKRLVNPHLRGWDPNVLDHHATRFMFLLRSRDASSDRGGAPVDAISQAASVEQDSQPESGGPVVPAASSSAPGEADAAEGEDGSAGGPGEGEP